MTPAYGKSTAHLSPFPTRTGGRLNPSNVRNRLLNGTPARNGDTAIKGVVDPRQREARGRRSNAAPGIGDAPHPPPDVRSLCTTTRA